LNAKWNCPILLSSQALSATHKEGAMKHKLTYALATLIFAVALVATPTKSHASFDSYLTVDGGGGNDGGSSGSGVGGSTLTGWFVQLLGVIGIR
jgi:hypothetical protein